jgi:hypothetical protein
MVPYARNPVVLAKAILGRDDTVLRVTDKTRSTRFNAIVSLISRIRHQLLHNRDFRAPYLELIHDLYTTGSPLERQNIQTMRPQPLTDIQLRNYLAFQWPELRLSYSTDMGFTFVGPASAGDGTVYINLEFVKRLQKLVRNVSLICYPCSYPSLR